MVLVDLLEAALGAVAGHTDLALPVGAVALLLAGIYYSREISGWLVGAARWLRIASVLIGGVAALAVAGLATGAIALDSGVVGQTLDWLSGLAAGL